MEILSVYAVGSRQRAINRRLAQGARVVLGACALMAASHLKVPFFFTPVPFTFQPQMVLFLAATLGAQEGVAAVATWLMAGALGAPCFAAAAPGLAALSGPTAGYLLSYLPVAAWVGTLGRGQGLMAFWVWLSGTLFTLSAGAMWLTYWVPQHTAWQLGFVPFVATDLLKMLMVFIGYRSLRYALPKSPVK